jgi:hypothetical protein
MRILTLLVFALLTLLVATSAGATDRVPDSALQLRILSREGMVLSVEVTNLTDDIARFNAVGLYFVPDNSDAPQRLGVVTPGQVATPDGAWTNASDTFDVAAHRSIRMKLVSYCIDEHRRTPGQTTYHLASRRMPTSLAEALAGAARTATSSGQDVQRAIWRVRATMPVALIGDSRVTE